MTQPRGFHWDCRLAGLILRRVDWVNMVCGREGSVVARAAQEGLRHWRSIEHLYRSTDLNQFLANDRGLGLRCAGSSYGMRQTVKPSRVLRSTIQTGRGVRCAGLRRAPSPPVWWMALWILII